MQMWPIKFSSVNLAYRVILVHRYGSIDMGKFYNESGRLQMIEIVRTNLVQLMRQMGHCQDQMLMGLAHADETSDASPATVSTSCQPVEGTLVNEWHYYVSIEGEESYLSEPYLSALPVAAPKIECQSLIDSYCGSIQSKLGFHSA